MMVQHFHCHSFCHCSKFPISWTFYSLSLSLSLVKMKMVLQSLVVPLFIILMSCPSCFCNFQKIPLSDNLDETQGHKPMSTVYSTSIATTIINRHGNFSSNFPTMVEHEKDIYRKLVQVGTKATSPRTFNVDDFGARGDKTDDSEVLYSRNYRMKLNV